MNSRELKNWAREEGIVGFSRMSKAELMELWEESQPERPRKHHFFRKKPAHENPLNWKNKKISAPILIPERRDFLSRRIPSLIKENVETVVDWTNWLENVDDVDVRRRTNPAIERLKKQIAQLWEKEFFVEERESALNGFARTYGIPGRPGFSPREFLKAVSWKVIDLLKRNKRTKTKMVLSCRMSRTELRTGDVIEQMADFHSRMEMNLEGSDQKELYYHMVERSLENLAKFQRKGSNWRFEEVVDLTIFFTEFRPLGGSSHIPLPSYLKTKKAVVNMKNEDEKCFKWCATRACFPVEKNAERISEELRKHAETLDWSGLSFPTPLSDISKFERRNPGLAVNVFGFEDGHIFPLKISEVKGKMIDLLWLRKNEKAHFCWIRSLSRLLSNQISKHNGKVVFCRRCLNHFPDEKSLEKHVASCSQFKAVRIIMPEKGSVVKFKNWHKKMTFPFVIYADFEARQLPTPSARPNPKESFTEKFQKHIPCSFAFHLVSPFVKRDPVLFRAENDSVDVGEKFVENLTQFVKEIQEEVKFPKRMIFGKKERKLFDAATACWICEKEFSLGEKRVRDHCHFSGEFRGAAHESCNLNFKKPKFTPVFFHNLTGYDAHLFVKNLGKMEGDITCIPNNEEKYISFSKKILLGTRLNDKGEIVKNWHEIRFLDSARFMTAPLGNLVKNLTDEDFLETRKVFGENWELMKRKGVFPYEWLDSTEKFQENLPDKKHFFSKLNDEDVSDEDYQFAEKVWEKMKMNNMGDFHDAYLKSDVTLLADVYQQFRKVCQKHYGVDPAWFYTSPGLAWDAALKESGAELELLTDPDMLLFFEKGIRGGVSTIMHRKARANNKFMGEKFNPEKPSTFIPYWDANSLYAWAMTNPLPVGEFEWMSEKELKDWEKIPCVLEVDVEIPDELHDFFNDLPPLPERKMIGKVEKLIPNLEDKEKIIVHRKFLKQALDLGCRLTKIWRGVKFREESWLDSFIQKNAALRQSSRNAFEKDFFKLMNNAVYGKTMENIRNRINFYLVSSEEKLKKLSSRPSFEHFTIFDKNLVGVHMRRTKMVFNKPIFVGQAILDISKTLIYDFHYKYVKQKWKEAQLCFTDTDSLLYEIETENLFVDIAEDVDAKFDTSDFSETHPCIVDGTLERKNKKVLGLMKDEARGEIIEEFVGLKPKLYSIKMHEGKGTKKCKGVKKKVVEKRISHEDFVACLESQKPAMRQMECIQSLKHELFSQTVNKIALSANDDKRFMCEDGIRTLAWGHWRLG